MPDLTIRRYDADDEEAVWTLHERSLRDAGAYDEEYAHLDADLRNVESEYLDAGGEFLVGEVERSATLDGERGGMPGERDSDVVAMGALQPSTDVDHHESDRDAAVVRRMRVDPGHQRRGHGSRILRELETCAADRGFEQLVLDTTPRQEAATALYESFGFREARREETPVGEMIFYTKEL